MGIPLKPCLDCGRLSRSPTRCDRCEPTHKRLRERNRDRPSKEARGLGATHRRVTREAIERQPWCTDCGHPGSKNNPLTGDHVIPRSRGGQSTPENIEVRCRRCNSKKGTR